MIVMPKPVYALVGDEPFLQLEKLHAIIAQFPADVQRIDIDGERATLGDVLDELRSFAMFGGGGKLVVIRDADEFLSRFREQLEEYVSNPSDSATLVLRLSSLPANQRIHKAIAKVGAIEPCEPPKDRDLPTWIMNRGKSQHKITLTPDAAQVLADRVGAHLGRLDNELAKLALAHDSAKGKVDADEVADGVAFQREQAMYEMTNALAVGDPAEALRRWRHLVALDPSTEFRAVTWLCMWLENVRKAQAMKKKGMNTFAIASALRIWPRENQEPFIKTATALGDSGVARAVDLLADVDKRSKSGLGEAKDNVERFILSMAQ